MNPVYNDGTVQYGSRVLVLKDAASGNPYDTYVCDGVSIRRPIKKIERTNEGGEPSGSVGVPGFVDGTLTGMQLANDNTKEPLNGLVFTLQFDVAFGVETFIVHDITRNEGKDVEKKFSANLTKKYN